MRFCVFGVSLILVVLSVLVVRATELAKAQIENVIASTITSGRRLGRKLFIESYIPGFSGHPAVEVAKHCARVTFGRETAFQVFSRELL